MNNEHKALVIQTRSAHQIHNQHMEKINDYWVDKNGNKWDCDLYTEEEAEECGGSLIDCYNCIDCNNCHDCDYCINCNYCDCYNYCIVIIIAFERN